MLSFDPLGNVSNMALDRHNDIERFLVVIQLGLMDNPRLAVHIR